MSFRLKLYFICLIFSSNAIFAKQQWEIEEANKGKIGQVNAPETWRTFEKRNELGLLGKYNIEIKLAHDTNSIPNIKNRLLNIEKYIFKTQKLGNILKSKKMIKEVEKIASQWLTKNELNDIQKHAKKEAKN